MASTLTQPRPITKATKTKSKVILFGSAFNPVGRHHEHSAVLLHQRTEHPVWWMPCYKHVFEKNSVLECDAHRWNMVKLVSDSYGSFLRACDFELITHSNGKMYDTLTGLREEHPDKEFILAIGMDNANVIRKPMDDGGWYRGEELIEENPFIVMSRRITCPVCHGRAVQCSYCKEEGTVWQQPTDDWFKREPHMELQFNYPCSSSALRKACEEGRLDFVRQHTHPLVFEYMQEAKLYGLS